jgi:hypothetical protein
LLLDITFDGHHKSREDLQAEIDQGYCYHV